MIRTKTLSVSFKAMKPLSGRTKTQGACSLLKISHVYRSYEGVRVLSLILKTQLISRLGMALIVASEHRETVSGDFGKSIRRLDVRLFFFRNLLDHFQSVTQLDVRLFFFEIYLTISSPFVIFFLISNSEDNNLRSRCLKISVSD